MGFIRKAIKKTKVQSFLKYFRIKKPPFLITTSSNVIVGRNSYHNGNFIVKGNGLLHVGNFCAIGNGVKIILSNHNFNYPSIQYTLYIKYFQKFPYSINLNNTVKIGSDVWIGDNVIILPNVNIGNGVCIGAGAIVTKDIPNYAIVAGNPAKIIKYRFDKNEIQYLEKVQWWNWTDEEIISNRNFFFKIPTESEA